MSLSTIRLLLGLIASAVNLGESQSRETGISSCEEQQQTFIELFGLDVTSQIWYPICTPGGYFRNVQCSFIGCFCVYLDTGMEIQNSKRGKSAEELLTICPWVSKEPPAQCSLPSKHYPCDKRSERYNFNPELKKCELSSGSCLGFLTLGECETTCDIHNSWTQWTSYSECSLTCGPGLSLRTRRCKNADGADAPSISKCPDPSNHGAFQSQTCNNGPCCSWTQWTAMSKCSVTCGIGQSNRTRRCATSDGADAANRCECRDPRNLGSLQSQSCNVGGECDWTQWTRWTSYSECSVTCGPGFSVRSRRCITADETDGPSFFKCPDPLNHGAFQTQKCNNGPCCSWTQWTAYSKCSPTCGPGQLNRTRRCATSDGTDAGNRCECPDPKNLGSLQSQPCSFGGCDSWTQWNSYSKCSATCGPGLSVRSRRCAIADETDGPIFSKCPDPLNLGAFQSQTCNNGPCYSWTLWTSFSECSAACGQGRSVRTRRCRTADGADAPSHSECPDPLNLGAFQSKPCNNGLCCSWTRWTSYSACSVTCGAGISVRTRIRPSASEEYRRACYDPMKLGTFQSRSCNLGPC